MGSNFRGCGLDGRWLLAQISEVKSQKVEVIGAAENVLFVRPGSPECADRFVLKMKSTCVECNVYVLQHTHIFNCFYIVSDDGILFDL